MAKFEEQVQNSTNKIKTSGLVRMGMSLCRNGTPSPIVAPIVL